MKATLLLWLAAGSLAACGPTRRLQGATDAGDGDGGTTPDVYECPRTCSDDQHSVLDCNGQKLADCTGTEACDVSQAICTNACTAAEANHRSVGCDYYATDMDSIQPDYCFAVFVANTWTSPAHIDVEYRGQQLAVASFARIPYGSGPTLDVRAVRRRHRPRRPARSRSCSSAARSGAAPLLPGRAGGRRARTSAAPASSNSFHITTDVPVVAYQINPYGGGSVAVTAASLLLPTSVWDTNYVAVNVSPQAAGAAVAQHRRERGRHGRDDHAERGASPAAAASRRRRPGSRSTIHARRRASTRRSRRAAELTGSVDQRRTSRSASWPARPA